MGWIHERVGFYVPDKDASSIYQPVFDDITTTLDHEEHGATPLLGINGVVMKCHGSSTARGINNSLLAAQKTIEGNLIEEIAERLIKYTAFINESSTIGERNPV